MAISSLLSTAPARYALAAVSVAVTYTLRLAFDPVLSDRAIFLVFVLPVVMAVLVWGRGPALFAGALSLVAAFELGVRAGDLSRELFAQGVLFTLVCAGIGWLEAQTRAQRSLAGTARSQLDLLRESATGYAIFTVDAAGFITTWNKGAEELLGWPPDQAIGQHCSILVPGADAHDLAMAQLEQARQSRRFSNTCWQKRCDGSEFLAEVTIAPLRDPSAGAIGFAKIIHDVTERQAEQRDLQRREQLLQSILATVPDAMVVIDDKGTILSFSHAAERLFGYTEADVAGRNVKLLMPSPDRERHDGYLARYIETKVPRIIGIGRIVTGLRADGSTFPMALSVGEAKSDDQLLFTGFIQDLTERRDFEARLEQLQSELIHVSRLSAMGTMASTLAHELNQPLTAIASYGEAAAALLDEQGELDMEILREAVGEMAAQSLRAGGIVRRLRQFVSRGDLTKTVEDLPKVIEEAGALALIGAREQNIETHFAFGAGATPVVIDRLQIQQVLINLMRNALEAMRDVEKKRLDVSTLLLDPATVEVTIADSGPGIPADVREKLFEAFNSSKTDGMGLGLSICRTIIEAHGGRIRGVDRPEGGTEFRFTLMRPEGVAP
jgi:two-component system, LuxR family, sensor kinase FixL